VVEVLWQIAVQELTELHGAIETTLTSTMDIAATTSTCLKIGVVNVGNFNGYNIST